VKSRGAFDIDSVRADFPHLEKCTYLNTASAGLSWAGQGRAAADFYDNAKSRGIGGQPDWASKLDDTRRELGEVIHVPPRDIHFVGSTTEALNLIALSLPLARGDQVVVAEDEFPSVVQPWMTLQSRGVQLIRVPVSRESDRTRLLCEAITDSVRVVAVSHVHWRTGGLIDLAALSKVCQQHDCRLIVDGVQAVGAVAVDAGLADAYCASVFKWLLSGFGLGFVSVSERLTQQLTPVFRGYANEPPSHSISYGHINYPGIYALRMSLEYLQSVGWEHIHGRVASLAQRSISALRERGFDVLTPEGAHAGIVSMRHPTSTRIARSLAEQSIFVEDGTPILRVSPHFYNTEDEVDRFVDAVAHSV
jgi:cysteine desulfurase / selenocysteine lyase